MLVHLLEDIAFLPVEVLFVTLVIQRLLSNREKRTRLEKMNLVIGAFFSEVGIWLLAYLSDMDPELNAIKSELVITNDWSDLEFSRVSSKLQSHDFRIEMERIDLEGLKRLMNKERDFFLRLIENPTLLEHESFTELLRAVFHVTEELASRQELRGLPATDIAHLEGDLRRVYRLLIRSWLGYMKYLKADYPYLFSLAMRTNPFDQTASPIVR
jgi:hypothetical protein